MAKERCEVRQICDTAIKKANVKSSKAAWLVFNDKNKNTRRLKYCGLRPNSAEVKRIQLELLKFDQYAFDIGFCSGGFRGYGGLVIYEL